MYFKMSKSKVHQLRLLSAGIFIIASQITFLSFVSGFLRQVRWFSSLASLSLCSKRIKNIYILLSSFILLFILYIGVDYVSPVKISNLQYCICIFKLIIQSIQFYFSDYSFKNAVGVAVGNLSMVPGAIFSFPLHTNLFYYLDFIQF